MGAQRGRMVRREVGRTRHMTHHTPALFICISQVCSHPLNGRKPSYRFKETLRRIHIDIATCAAILS